MYSIQTWIGTGWRTDSTHGTMDEAKKAWDAIDLGTVTDRHGWVRLVGPNDYIWRQYQAA